MSVDVKKANIEDTASAIKAGGTSAKEVVRCYLDEINKKNENTRCKCDYNVAHFVMVRGLRSSKVLVRKCA